MSVANSQCVDDQIYRTTFDPATTSPCAAVVEAIDAATAGGETPSVLADSIDPDALIQLYRDGGSRSWMLNFEHDGTEVTLWGDGRIHVDATTVGETVRSGERTTGPNTVP